VEDSAKEKSLDSPAAFERVIDRRPLNEPTEGGVLLTRNDAALLAGTGMVPPRVAKPGPLVVDRVTVQAELKVLEMTSVTAEEDPTGVTGNDIVSPSDSATAEPPAD
jgi:hypothetical protein